LSKARGGLKLHAPRTVLSNGRELQLGGVTG
jgi:hypothetical protein